MTCFTARVADVCLPCYYAGGTSQDVVLVVPVHHAMRQGALIREALDMLRAIPEHAALATPKDWRAARAALKRMDPWCDRRKRSPWVRGIERGNHECYAYIVLSK
jgi:hypothetical protein